MSDDPLLVSDCMQCAALCCVALAFDKSPQFKIDKPAGDPCPNLSTDHQCTIHSSLESDGYKGCVQFDCLGAGQRVTQELFDGKSWQQDPTLLTPMMDAFWMMRQVHEQLQLLSEAAKLSLPADKREEQRQFEKALRPAQGWTQASLAAFIESGKIKDIGAFMVSLKPYVSQQTNS
jgi:hypothetical protein